ncbi:MAG: hypothetical protein KGL39_04300 [Patescibacteria group bacterium]|nr:hypothetical protein [Patescibacteria group bacterium]
MAEQAQILIRYDTSANWTANNPVLGQGEIGIVQPVSVGLQPMMKIGDGTSSWNTLPIYSMGALQPANNLSDVDNADTSRLNLEVPILAPAACVATANEAALSGLLTIDGHTLSSGELVLLTAQTTSSQNGTWVAGSGSWTRPNDFAANAVVGARLILVVNGTSHANTVWALDAPSGGVIVGTSSQSWTNIVAGGGGGVTNVSNSDGSITVTNGSTTPVVSLALSAASRAIVKDVTGSSIYSAADPLYGLKWDGSTDDSAAWNSMLTAIATAGGGLVVCPAAVSICEGVVWPSNVFAIGVKGVTQLKAPTNATQPSVVISENFVSLYLTDTDGLGIFQAGLYDMIINGNYANQTQKVILPPATFSMSASGSGGTIPAGTYAGMVTAVNSFGETDPIDARFVTVASGQTVSCTWSSVTGASSYNLYLVLLSAWDGSHGLFQVNVTGTSYTLTSYSSTGHRSPDRGVNTTALCGMLWYGANFDMRGLTVYDCPSNGWTSSWNDASSSTNSYTFPNPGMESRIEDCRFYNNYRHNFVYGGPHDSMIENCLAYFPGTYSTTDSAVGVRNFLINSTVHMISCHAYGSAAFGIDSPGESFYTNCVAEGANVAQVRLVDQGCTWNGGDVFPSSGSSSVGFRIGDVYSNGQVANIHGVNIEGFSGTSGNVAFDLTSAGNECFITATVNQAAGDVFLSSVVPAGATIQLMCYGGCTPSVIAQLGNASDVTASYLDGSGVTHFANAIATDVKAPISHAGPTSGTVTWQMPFVGTNFKMLILTFASYENDTPTNDVFNTATGGYGINTQAPFSLTISPSQIFNETGLTVNVAGESSPAGNQITITTPNNTTLYSGRVVFIGV